ncbi:MAG: hypothetical protein ACRD0H_08490 [Actinomycetes bacterium]
MSVEQIQALADGLATRLGRAVLVDDRELRLVAASEDFGDADPARIWSLLHRRTRPEDVRHEEIARLPGPGYVPENPALELWQRLCVPIRCRGLLLRRSPADDDSANDGLPHESPAAFLDDVERFFLHQPGVRTLTACWPRRATVIITGRAIRHGEWLGRSVRALLGELSQAGSWRIGAGGPVQGLTELPVARRQADIALSIADDGGAACWAELSADALLAQFPHQMWPVRADLRAEPARRSRPAADAPRAAAAPHVRGASTAGPSDTCRRTAAQSATPCRMTRARPVDRLAISPGPFGSQWEDAR